MTTPYPLGRNVNHDPRSLAYPFKADGITVTPIRWKRDAPTWDQGQLGSCTGNASCGLLVTDPFYATLPAGTVIDESTAVSVYSDATKIDGAPGSYPPDDTGSDGLSVAKILKSRGLISGYTHVFSAQDALKALSTQPLITGTNWYNSMFSPDANGVISIAAGDQPAGGHEYILDEIKIENGVTYIGMQNSWGSSWGIQGRAYMTLDTFTRLLSEQGDVTAFVPISKPAPVPVPPAPTPVPPAPTPVPPSDPNASMWTDIKDWACGTRYGKSRSVAARLRAWAKEQGLL